MEAYRRVDDLRSPAGWLPVHRDQLRAQRSVSSTGTRYLYLFTCCAFDADVRVRRGDDYVRVFLFDFSKAFDTVRHETLTKKMATLRELPDNIHNWIRDFFSDRRHSTRYAAVSAHQSQTYSKG